VRERFERVGQISAVRSDIRKRKALEWLLERAEVLDPEGATIDRSELELPSDEDDDTDDSDDTATDEVAEGTEAQA
jgi:trigger factor